MVLKNSLGNGDDILQVGFVGLQLYHEGKLYSSCYHFMYHRASCLPFHHVKHVLLSRVVNDSDRDIVDRASEEGFPVETGFHNFDPSLEPEYIDNQGKPWIHLNHSLMFYKSLYHFCLYMLH